MTYKQLQVLARILKDKSTSQIMVELEDGYSIETDDILLTVDTCMTIKLSNEDYRKLTKLLAKHANALPKQTPWTISVLDIEYNMDWRPVDTDKRSARKLHEWKDVYRGTDAIRQTSVCMDIRGYDVSLWQHTDGHILAINNRYLPLIQDAGTGYQDETNEMISFPDILMIIMPMRDTYTQACLQELEQILNAGEDKQ